MNDTLVMLAWCDPDCRRVRYTWSGIWVGILEASKERLTFRVNRQEIVSTEITDSSLIWRRTTKLFASRFDLHTADGNYRFYLSPPGTDAPSPAPDLLHTLSKSLDHVSVFGLLDGAVGAIGDAAGVAGDALSSPAPSHNCEPETGTKKYCVPSSPAAASRRPGRRPAADRRSACTHEATRKPWAPQPLSVLMEESSRAPTPMERSGSGTVSAAPRCER